MIVYKWVIKEKNKFSPLINCGIFKPFDNIKLMCYEKGKTVKNYINPYEEISYIKKDGRMLNGSGFHMAGFHFWLSKNNERYLKQFDKCMNRLNKKVNCILTCLVREKDIIKKDDKRLIASKFRVLREERI